MEEKKKLTKTITKIINFLMKEDKAKSNKMKANSLSATKSKN